MADFYLGEGGGEVQSGSKLFLEVLVLYVLYGMCQIYFGFT